MKKRFVLLTFLISTLGFSQSVNVILPGQVLKLKSTNLIAGSSIYLIQNNNTVAKAKGDNQGFFTLAGTIATGSPFEVQISKPGFISKKISFDVKKLEIPKKVNTITVKLLDSLIVELIPVKAGVNIQVGDKEYAEKYTWNEALAICQADTKFKQKNIDSVLQIYKNAELKIISDGFKQKSSEFERVKNYTMAIQYIDSATKVGLKDTTIVSKRISLEKAKALQEKEILTLKEIEKNLREGDSLLTLFKWKEAELKYKEALKKDPKNAKAIDKIAEISVIKAADEKRKAELKLYGINRASCTKLAASKKYSEAITAIKKNELLQNIPSVLKERIPGTLDSLNALVGLANLEKEIKTELTNAKAFSVKGDLTNSKAAYEKVFALISNHKDPKKQEVLKSETDKQISQFIDAEIKKAYDLHTKKQYDKAIDSYQKAMPLISILSDKALQTQKINDVNDKIKSAQKSKLDDEKKFQEAIVMVKNKLDSATFDPQFNANPEAKLAKVKSLLSTEPLKSKASMADIKALNDRYLKVNAYFTSNKLKVKELELKDSLKALAAANALLIASGTAEVGKIEVAFVTKKLDILKKKMEKPAPVAKSNTRGFVLNVPQGTTEVKGSVQDAYKDIMLSEAMKKQKVDLAMDKIKDDIDSKNELTQLQEAERAELQIAYVAGANDQRAIIDQKEIDRNKALELQNVKAVDQNSYDINRINKENLELTNNFANYSEKVVDQKDVANAKTIQQNEENRKESTSIVDKTIDNQDVRKLAEYESHLLRVNEQRTVTQNYEVSTYKNEVAVDSINKRNQKAQDKLTDYIDLRTYEPNYLKDENGVCFPWNKMTEKIYESKNEMGFTYLIIVRRIVVNPNGYGVVFEQTTTDSGHHAYTLNGQSIPESVWMHDSTGEPVFAEGVDVKTDCN